jgi:hypothetical protein
MPNDNLPSWVTRDKNGVFNVDPDVAYPQVLKALKVEKPDQYWLEVAYQCVKLKVQALASGAGQDPSRPVVIHIEGGAENKKSWALSNFPAGRGAMAATKGLEAKAHYERIRESF